MKTYHKLPTLLSSVLIVMSMSAYGQEEEPLSPQELEKFISINAQDIVNAREHRAALQRQFDEKLQQLREENQQLKATVEKLTQTLEQTAASTKAYADTKANAAEQAAKNYTEAYAELYASIASEVEQNAKNVANDAKDKAIEAQQTANFAVSVAKIANGMALNVRAMLGEGIGWCDCQKVYVDSSFYEKNEKSSVCDPTKFMVGIFWAHKYQKYVPGWVKCCRPCNNLN